MKFDRSIYEGKLIKRYKRFFADVELAGQNVVVAHVPNSGSMKGCQEPNSSCWVSYVDDPERKLKYTLETVQTPTSWVGVNTSRPNLLVHELWHSKRRTQWQKWNRIQREIKINSDSRIDFVMWDFAQHSCDKLVKTDFKKVKGLHFVEVKNVSLAEKNVALFPDSVTLRGQKHIDELIQLRMLGHTAELVFVVQRTDCQSFAPADEVDPEYGRKLRRAKKAGVTITALSCEITKEGISLNANPMPVIL